VALSNDRMGHQGPVAAGLLIWSMIVGIVVGMVTFGTLNRPTENELSDFSRLWHRSCGETCIEAQHVDRNHSPKV
jgi:hypothetical protein